MKIEEIKDGLRIAYVLEQYGHFPSSVSDSRLRFHSPFRADNNPSFDVFRHSIAGKEPEERWGDFATDEQGDVLDLLSLLEDCTTVQAIGLAEELLRQQLEEGWEGPTPRDRAYAVDQSRLDELILKRRPLEQSPVWVDMVVDTGQVLEQPPNDVVFCHPTTGTVVFVLYDFEGNRIGARYRTEDGKKLAMKGTRPHLMHLGGEDDRERPVLIVEGERDLWHAHSYHGHTARCLAVPGVTTKPDKAGAKHLMGRRVYLAFDGDEPGRKGMRTWSSWLLEHGCDVWVYPMPDGKDFASLSHGEAQSVLAEAHRIYQAPDVLVEGPDYYALPPGKDKPLVPLSNFTLQPTRVLSAENGTRGYEVEISHTRQRVVLPPEALASHTAFAKWGRANRCYWYGSTTSFARLEPHLEWQGLFLPPGNVHDQIGLTRGSFVYPAFSIGKHKTHFSTGRTAYPFDDTNLFVDPKRQVSRTDIDHTLGALVASQHRSVTEPILAWLAAAPLRRLIPKFPILAISGASGSGKTTLIEYILRTFTESTIMCTLTSSTPFSVESLIDSSCGHPVWFDEYRPGARSHTKLKLDQLMRDAYGMQPSLKGNVGTQLELVTTRTMAPIVVSGEDNLTEVSHLDRSIVLRLRAADQGPILDDVVPVWATYLAWLADRYTDVIYLPPAPQVAGITPRQHDNLRVLQLGWGLLQDFVGSYIGDLDLSQVTSSMQERDSLNPVRTLIEHAADNIDTARQASVYLTEDSVYVHPLNLLQLARETPSVVLPVTNSAGLKTLLVEEFGGGEVYTRNVGAVKLPSRKRLVKVPLAALGMEQHGRTEIDATSFVGGLVHPN